MILFSFKFGCKWYGLLNIKSSSVLNSDAISSTSNKPERPYKMFELNAK